MARRKVGVALAVALAALATASVPVLAGASGPEPTGGTSGPVRAGSAAQPGDLVEVRLGDLHPTQPAIGFDEVYYKLDRYRAGKDEQAGGINKRFDDWCEANGQGAASAAGPDSRLADPASFTCEVPVGQETSDTIAAMKTVVLGPGDVPYLTDGHHSLTELLESPDGGPDAHVRVRVEADLSDLAPADFWARMAEHRWVWLRDADDKEITPDQLPARLGLDAMGDDRYRGLVYFTRDIGYEQQVDAAGGSPEFLEFYWATWLRRSYDLDDYDLTDPASYLDVIEHASKDMTKLDDGDEVADGRTAGELGRLAKWNDGKAPEKGEFGDLATPMSDPKPGKLAYALDFKAQLP